MKKSFHGERKIAIKTAKREMRLGKYYDDRCWGDHAMQLYEPAVVLKYLKGTGHSLDSLKQCHYDLDLDIYNKVPVFFFHLYLFA